MQSIPEPDIESSMTNHPDIAVLTARVAKAAVDCERWRASGRQDRYMEAFDDVEALEQQLETAIRDLSRDERRGPGDQMGAAAGPQD
jgi:hypothetical protein